jgi:YbbR domain-containing protein
VIIAIIVWFVVATSEQQEVSFYVPIKFVSEPEGLKAFTDVNLVSVLVKGPKVSMKSLSFNDIRIEIDVSSFKNGEYLYRIKPKDVILPSGISLVRVEPQDIRFIIDKVGKKMMKVVPSFIGEVKDGFKIVRVTINPSYVTVFGTSKKIKNIDSVETLPINISNLDKDMKIKVGIKLNEIITTAKPSEVDVDIKVSENIISKEITDFDIYMEGLDKRLNNKVILKKKKVSFVIRGRSDKLNNLDQLKAVVDLSKINKSGLYEVHVQIKGIDDVEVIDVIPSVVRVEVKR